ncbi:RNA ligase [Ferroglobus sp.]|uniref:RNA ligase n=1 Tax=Ferroglobus sp. TaxID=2614230 RepID=UPI0025C1316D|nr:RNA ligase [Ferroglobus sp.]
MYVAEALGLTKPAAEKLKEKNVLKEAFIKHPFFPDVIDAVRFDKKFAGLEEGTVVAKTIHGVEVVHGFPKIRRALTLYPTIKLHFKGEIVFEEKMNGYNVRIVMFGKNLYALTRRGFICPYTTEKARELINESFFKDFPKFMLCCEAVGKYSPYVPKDVYGVDFDFYVFDIREKRSGKPLPIREKERICEEYGLNLAPILAECRAEEGHIVGRRVIEELEGSGREGVVIKDVNMVVEPIKYTTSETNCSDLSYAFRYFNEYGKDFMFSRIVREGFQSFEFDDEEKFRERCFRLGKAILESLVKSIKDVSEGRKVVERVELTFSSFETFELFTEHLKRSGVNFEVVELKKREGKVHAIIDRVMKSTTDKIKSHLGGALW